VKIESGVKYCQRPCDITKEFILQNGSCSPECPSPLIRKEESGVGIHCLNPCESNETLKNNDGSLSCITKCPDSFETKFENGFKYCINPCSSELYYFDQNKSCLDTCPYPTLKEGFHHICKNPCLGSSNYFIYDDQSCHEDCLQPLIVERNFCKSPCKENEYLNLHGDCQEICEHPYITLRKGPYQLCRIDLNSPLIDQARFIRRIVKTSNTISEFGGILSCFLNAGDSLSIFAIPLLGMFDKIGYTKMIVPTNLEFILTLKQEEVVGIFKWIF